MAGQPFLRAVVAKIKAAGGISPVLERVASGESLTKIAATYGCSRHTLYKIFHKTDRLWNLFQEARRESAFALAEQGTEILDDMVGHTNTREDIALARERVAQRRWLAQSYDRDTFGIQTPDQGAPITIGSLHLRVLQATLPQPALPAPRTVDAEVIEEKSSE